MTERSVRWNPVKESLKIHKNFLNSAPLYRNGQLTHKNMAARRQPSNAFSKQWVSREGYNVLPANLGGIQIQNPEPVVSEPNEPWRPMPSTGIYSPSGRKNALKSFPNGELFARPENIPANYTAGVYARPLVMPVYVPRRTNGAPIPKRTNGGPAPKRSKPSRTRKAKKN
jgi:hypothetical protein